MLKLMASRVPPSPRKHARSSFVTSITLNNKFFWL
jgi:hypothetical protein